MNRLVLDGGELVRVLVLNDNARISGASRDFRRRFLAFAQDLLHRARGLVWCMKSGYTCISS